MKRKILNTMNLFCFLILVLFFSSCNGKETKPSSQTEKTTFSETETTENENAVLKNSTVETTVPLKERNPRTIPSYLNDNLLKGIDISEFSGKVDFEKVKDDGISFVMVRLGGRGYGAAGTLYTDEKALEYIQNAKEAGLKVGGYFFSQAVNEEEAAEEADYSAEILNGETLDFPIAFDWEKIEDDTARTDNLSDTVLTVCAKAFCDRINEKGYKFMIYAKENVYNRYNHTVLSEYDFWYSEYTDTPSITDGYTMWQYSENGEINGIEGETDINVCYKNY